MSTPSPRPAGPYTPVVRAGDLLICSGQLGLEGDRLVEGGVAAETTQAVANVRALLASAGASLGEVVKVTVYLADIGDFDAMNAAYAEAFGDHRPARTAVAVHALPRSARVEVEAWAFCPPR